MLINFRVAIVVFSAFFGCASSSYAVNLPSVADGARVEVPSSVPSKTFTPPPTDKPLFPPAKIFDGNTLLRLTLESVDIEGMTAFKPEEMQDITRLFIGQNIAREQLFIMAGQITERYRNSGYFLSQAQVISINKGKVKFRVIEGYVGEIIYQDKLGSYRVVKQWLDRLKHIHPLRMRDMENVLLQLNDLPGVSLRAVLEPAKDKNIQKQGGVRLNLIAKKEHDTATIAFNNQGSRYLGPYQAIGTYQTSLIPLQKTTVTGLTSLPFDELNYGSISHAIPVYAGLTLELYGSHTGAVPGYLLEQQDINSNSDAIGAALNYKPFHTRREELNLRVAFEGRNTDTDIISSPLTRDKTRVVRLGANYNLIDTWEGINTAQATFSQGISGIGSSKAGASNLSREEAEPDFQKFEVNYSRLQTLAQEFDGAFAAAGQVASGPLYSSEEFGYGGQNFGRAYDSSEITGDHGVSLSFEVRYKGVPQWEGITTQPYAFYDAGIVWNEDSTDTGRQSGTSTGVGVRSILPYQVQSDFGLAFPLTREQQAPLLGKGNTPRIMWSVSRSF